MLRRFGFGFEPRFLLHFADIAFFWLGNVDYIFAVFQSLILLFN